MDRNEIEHTDLEPHRAKSNSDTLSGLHCIQPCIYYTVKPAYFFL